MSDDVRYYRVSPRFWTRAEQKGWSDDTKLLALYLLTCPHRTTEGLYRMPKKYAQADLEWSPQRFTERLAELIRDGFCDYDDDAQVVLIHGAMRYQSCANDNMAKGAAKRLAELPETRLTCTFKRLAERLDERLAKHLPERFGEPQALAQALPQAPSPGESSPDDDGGSGDAGGAESEELAILDSFEKFWAIYPERDSKKLGRGNALVEWRKLTLDERRRAYIGAEYLSASGQRPKDAERFLRKTKGGDFPFDDWQTPSVPDDERSNLSTMPDGRRLAH